MLLIDSIVVDFSREDVIGYVLHLAVYVFAVPLPRFFGEVRRLRLSHLFESLVLVVPML